MLNILKSFDFQLRRLFAMVGVKFELKASLTGILFPLSVTWCLSSLSIFLMLIKKER